MLFIPLPEMQVCLNLQALTLTVIGPLHILKVYYSRYSQSNCVGGIL